MTFIKIISIKLENMEYYTEGDLYKYHSILY